MPKTIKNLDWMKLILKEHQPYVTDVGTQRDPENLVSCYCQFYVVRNKAFPKYSDHILDLIRAEFPGIFEYDEEREPSWMGHR